jgi:hypothetical protein
MKKSLIPFLLISLLNLINLSAQNNKMDFLIKYDFISLLGDQVTSSMGFQLGAELHIREKQSLSMDAMYIFPCQSCQGAYTRINTESTYGYMLASEYRFYLLGGDHQISGLYLGPQILFQHTKSVLRETYESGVDNQYQVYRNLMAAHVMTGYQFRISGPLFFNPALGVGIRFVNSRNLNKKGTDSGQHEFPYDKDFESGSKWFLGFNACIKLGIKL